jgi:hypothetical protein
MNSPSKLQCRIGSLLVRTLQVLFVTLLRCDHCGARLDKQFGHTPKEQ